MLLELWEGTCLVGGNRGVGVEGRRGGRGEGG